MVVLELLHLKIEVTVSEPCDVIRVNEYLVGQEWQYGNVSDKFDGRKWPQDCMLSVELK